MLQVVRERLQQVGRTGGELLHLLEQTERVARREDLVRVRDKVRVRVRV